ncbi:helix-turn-helix domain-containing protein [Maribellus comscasis]|uniref:Helix-turn-helix domain-containing protein n=1 Tax=Maribellus comscasis TaxID=2681766 RepID=A0A6I6JWB9_9BACT|nr:response regulator transcription factor [Maribellus comscasis]QGY45609.1 helix-turn-helix domain-containing protein [Maribellus comscasis]
MVKNKTESIEEFYKRKFEWIPENIRNEIGHFNLFKVEPPVGGKRKPVPYQKRDYYKIMITKGESKVLYADQVVDVKGYALTFSNPQIPYKWDCLEGIEHGVFCVFNQEFFSQFGSINKYSVFQPGSSHIFTLNTEQAKTVFGIYERMFDEITSDYIHKYDVLRNLVFELIHLAMKMEPSAKYNKQHFDANKRISMLFMELLERQFPVDESHSKVELRTASDFADQLAVHVNHLNRAVKSVTGKTTTEVITSRILQESKILLTQSDWNVSEIAFALGFTEATHFNNFFKKHTNVSPTKFKSI